MPFWIALCLIVLESTFWETSARMSSSIGMRTVAAGYEFAHRDDYEGRKVLPDIKIDADSRNIEELTVTPDPDAYVPRKSDEALTRLSEQGLAFKGYEGMMPTMPDETLILDDISHCESERLIDIYKPDIFCAGIKEKYAIQKKGVPSLQLHSYDYGGPYAGFAGAITFYQTINRMVNARIWDFIEAPWDKRVKPKLDAELIAN